MIRIVIPNRGLFELQHAVFDINGTLAIDGVPIVGVTDHLKALSAQLSIHMLTAGTHGNLEELERAFGYPLQKINTGKDKAHYVEKLGPASVVAFGNGANDADMLHLAAIGIAVLSEEGLATSALQVADLLALGPVNAIELLLNPKRLVATLRG